MPDPPQPPRPPHSMPLTKLDLQCDWEKRKKYFDEQRQIRQRIGKIIDPFHYQYRTNDDEQQSDQSLAKKDQMPAAAMKAAPPPLDMQYDVKKLLQHELQQQYPPPPPMSGLPPPPPPPLPPPPPPRPCEAHHAKLNTGRSSDKNSSSNLILVSTTASSKAIASPDVCEVGRPTRDNLDVAKFLVLNAKSLCSSNEELFVKSIDCVLNPVYKLFESDKKGLSGGTTNDDLMPGCGSTTAGEGMPFGGSLASLISDKPASAKLKEGQPDGFTEVSGKQSDLQNDVESCGKDSLCQALSGLCGENGGEVISMQGKSIAF